MKLLIPNLLLVAATAIGGETQRAESYQVLYLADSGIVGLQMTVLIDGQSPKQRFEGFVDALLAGLDKNGDGVLTVDEARGKILTGREAQLMQIGFAEGPPTETSPDVNPQDGKISRLELLAYFKRIGLQPLSVRYVPRTPQADPNTGAMVNQPGEAPLFDRLDLDGDKRLSVSELASALDTLRKLDRDDDETISIAELQPLATAPVPVARQSMNNAAQAPLPFASPATGESVPKMIRRIVDKYDSADPVKSGVPSLSTKNQRLSRQELAMPEPDFVKFDVDGDGQLDFTELRQFVSSSAPTMELTIDVTEGKAQVAGLSSDVVRIAADGTVNLQFGGTQISILAIPTAGEIDPESAIKPLFTAIDSDANGYLEKSEAPDNAFFGAAFTDLDADKNGKLYPDEIVAYLKPRMDAARSRAELSIIEQGRTLFDILDSDRDGRLAHREVRNVADKLALWDTNGDGQLSEAEIPLQFRLVAAQGSLMNLGPRVQGSTDMVQRNIPAVSSGGPLWFRKMDRNGDGEISSREFLGEVELFDKLDLNHDGAIELYEARQAKTGK